MAGARPRARGKHALRQPADTLPGISLETVRVAYLAYSAQVARFQINGTEVSTSVSCAPARKTKAFPRWIEYTVVSDQDERRCTVSSNVTVADGQNVVRRDVKVPQVLAESGDGLATNPMNEAGFVGELLVWVRSVRVRSADSTSFCSIRRKSCRRSAAFPSTSMSECGCRRAPPPESGEDGGFSVDRRKLDLIGCARSDDRRRRLTVSPRRRRLRSSRAGDARRKNVDHDRRAGRRADRLDPARCGDASTRKATPCAAMTTAHAAHARSVDPIARSGSTPSASARSSLTIYLPCWTAAAPSKGDAECSCVVWRGLAWRAWWFLNGSHTRFVWTEFTTPRILLLKLNI